MYKVCILYEKILAYKYKGKSKIICFFHYIFRIVTFIAFCSRVQIIFDFLSSSTCSQVIKALLLKCLISENLMIDKNYSKDEGTDLNKYLNHNKTSIFYFVIIWIGEILCFDSPQLSLWVSVLFTKLLL